MKLTLNITDEDIRHGEKMDCKRCPIARALRRAALNELGCRTNLTTSVKYSKMQVTVFAEDHEEEYVIDTPSACSEFMGLFDRGGLAGPFAVEIEFRGPFRVV